MASTPKTHYIASLPTGSDDATSTLVAGTEVTLHKLIGGSGVNGVIGSGHIEAVDCKLCLKALQEEAAETVVEEVEDGTDAAVVSIQEQVAEDIHAGNLREAVDKINAASEANTKTKKPRASKSGEKAPRKTDGLPSRKEILAELAELGYDGPTSYLKPKLHEILVEQRG